MQFMKKRLKPEEAVKEDAEEEKSSKKIGKKKEN